MDEASLRGRWRNQARRWIEWSRNPEFDDDFWSYHLDAFLDLVPVSDGLTLDVACGEGRVTRALQELGYRCVGLDAAEALVEAAVRHPAAAPAVVADAEALPFGDGAAQLVVAFMCLHDMDDLPRVISEIARVVSVRGKVAIAVLHPYLSGTAIDYFDEQLYEVTVERAGRTMRYTGVHRSIQRYFDLLSGAGLQIEELREIGNTQLDPPALRFLHLLASPVDSGDG